MSFSLARKYRPQVFSDMVGQDVLTKVLSFSILDSKLASSFLFTGIRGIGKTTAARIIAQTINCNSAFTENKLVIACQKCSSCLSAQKQSHPDIVELDAASYTSVDNIRDIIDQSIYLPILGKYKVFIIDEAHMLSKSAFNALLKILEEPPAQVIFILLTTESTKIPITVASRCQKFNLKRLGSDDLDLLLKKVCRSESIKYEQDALDLISYKADGSARDALVLLEQAWCLATQKGNQITLDMLEDILDLSYISGAIQFLSFITNQDIKSALSLAKSLYERNFDFTSMLDTLIELLACLIKMSLVSDYDLGCYKPYASDLERLKVDTGLLTSWWQIFNKSTSDFASGKNHLMYFEMLLIKAVYCKMLPSSYDLKTNQKTSFEINNSTTQTQLANFSDTSSSQDCSLTDFVKYICSRSWFDLYHFIVNECQILEFNDGNIHLAVKKINEELRIKLERALLDWTDKDWHLSFSTKTKFISFNQKLRDDLLEDDQFKLIQSFFPEVLIKDIGLNTSQN